MRKQALAVATMLLLAIVAATGHLYAQEPVLKAKIPFEFTVGSKILPAGEYRVERPTSLSLSLVLLRRNDGAASAIVFTIPIQANNWQDKSKLVFNRYGDHYFLSQIWTEGDNRGHKLSPSPRETEAARKQVKEEIALLVR